MWEGQVGAQRRQRALSSERPLHRPGVDGLSLEHMSGNLGLLGAPLQQCLLRFLREQPHVCSALLFFLQERLIVF